MGGYTPMAHQDTEPPNSLSAKSANALSTRHHPSSEVSLPLFHSMLPPPSPILPVLVILRTQVADCVSIALGVSTFLCVAL